MNWILAIIVCAIIGAIIGFIGSGKKEGAFGGAVMGGVGCGYLIVQITIVAIGFLIIIKVFSWLFS
jgi:hypothetical protein